MREEEFEALRSWGDALVRDPRAEVAAAGKAIQLLAAEVERLEMELWNLRLGVVDTVQPMRDHAPPVQRELTDDLHLQVSRGHRLRSLLTSPSKYLHDR